VSGVGAATVAPELLEGVFQEAQRVRAEAAETNRYVAERRAAFALSRRRTDRICRKCRSTYEHARVWRETLPLAGLVLQWVSADTEELETLVALELLPGGADSPRDS
jgi:hypothetical protein